MEEANSSLVGQVIWLGFRRKSVPYKRCRAPLARAVGRSAARSATCSTAFSRSPICRYRTGTCGGNGPDLLHRAGNRNLSGLVIGLDYRSRLYAIILTVLLSRFSQLLAIGVVGAYVWRTFNNTSAGRPLSPCSASRSPQTRNRATHEHLDTSPSHLRECERGRPNANLGIRSRLARPASAGTAIFVITYSSKTTWCWATGSL